MAEQPSYAAKTFLLIDDESFALGLVERILKQCQAGRVLRAGNGAAALAMFNGEAGAVDCIVADLHMKPMNGLELLKAIRTGVGKQIPRDQRVVMMTGDRDLDAVRTAGELDINGYVLKPVTTENLVAALDKAFNRSPLLRDAEHYRAVQLPDMSGG